MNRDKLVDVFTSYYAPGIGTHSAEVLFLMCHNDTVSSSYSRVVQNYFATGHNGLLLRRFGWYRNSGSAQGKSWHYVAT